MANTVKRLNYYDHQFLRVPDFTDEQNYHLNMRRLHNSALHTWGIIQGLQVTLASGGTGTAVSVNAGVAIDSTGREIVLPADTNLELGGEAAGTTLFITIAYGEQQTDPTTEAGGPGNTRITEMPNLSFSKTAPADTSMTLILARVPRTTTGLGPVDGSDRRQAGTVLGDNLTISTLTLRKDGIAQSNWPVLSCSAASQAAFNAGLVVNGTGLVVNGSVGVGPAAPNRNLTISGAGSTGTYANIKNGSNEVLLGVDTVAVLSTMTASDLQIRTNNATRVVVGSDGNVGIGARASRGALEVSTMVGNTTALFGKDLGVSLVANWPNIGFNSYFNGTWKSLSPGWSGVIGVDQNDGSMNFMVAPTKAAAADAALTPPSRLSIHVDGKLVSPMWRATQVMNQRQGPLPINAAFASGGGTLVIIFSGSGFSAGGTNIGLVMQIDGSSVATTRSFTNEPSSHKAFTTNILVQANVAAGAHTLTLAPLVGTSTDGNDWFNVAVLELPF
jgi:hypothetical protein